MRVTRTGLTDVLLIEPRVFEDERGWFKQNYQKREYEEAGVRAEFVQDNRSHSRRGVLRGLHFQEPFAQGKLVEVILGAIYDVAVDIRKGSPTFGEWFGIELSAQNHLQLWIPPGFAHGFVALHDATEVSYRCTAYYAPKYEHILLWNDPDLSIEWPIPEGGPFLSARDAAGIRLGNLSVVPQFTGG